MLLRLIGSGEGWQIGGKYISVVDVCCSAPSSGGCEYLARGNVLAVAFCPQVQPDAAQREMGSDRIGSDQAMLQWFLYNWWCFELSAVLSGSLPFETRR